MTDDKDWEETIKGVKRLKNNRYTEDVKPKEISIRRDKVRTVAFEMLKIGKGISKDDFTHMDGSLTKRFKREEIRVEAVLDLHGSTEKEAFEQVTDFIKTAFDAHKRCVLIVTGKGKDDSLISGKGILRKSVPGWLTNSKINSLILAFKNPSESLGGAGALYILLRKKQESKLSKQK